MSDELNNLEREFDAELAAMNDVLDVSMPSDVAERTRLATRIALDESVIQEIPAPEPSAETIDRVCEHVRHELQSQTSQQPSHYRRWPGLLAAAAAIALAIGVAQQFNSTATDGTKSNDNNDNTLLVNNRDNNEVDVEVFAAFVEATDDLMTSTISTLPLEEDLAELEQTMTTWESSWSDLNDALEAIEASTSEQSRDSRIDAALLTRATTDETGAHG